MQIDLKKNEQEYLLASDDKILEFFNDKIKIEAELDIHMGMIVWHNGILWFKKEWKLLSGTWEDDNHNFIEIKSNNTCRYNPFSGDVVGFKLIQVQLPNGTNMKGNISEENVIVWDNDTKWKRYSEKGCLIM